MKLKYTLSSIVIMLLLAGRLEAGATFTAKPAGGNYSNASSWTISGGSDADGIPDSDDNVIINSGITITVSANNQASAALTVASGAFLTFNNVDIFTSYGIVTVNGTINGTFSGATHAYIKALSSNGFTGSGTINITGDLRFSSLAYIYSGVTVNNTGNIIIGSSTTVGIYAHITLTGSVDGTSGSSQLNCLTGSVLSVQGQLMATAGTVLASTASYCANNTIIFDGASAYNIGTATFENVIIRGTGIKTTSNGTATTINKTLTIDAGATIQQSASQAITLNGPFVNNGTFTGSGKNINFTGASYTNNGTLTDLAVFYFSGATAKTITGTGTSTFTSLIVQNAAVTKNSSSVVINNSLQVTGVNFNNSGGSLTIGGTYSFTSGGTFTAGNTGNTVVLAYTANSFPPTTSGYYNLTLGAASASTKSLTANTVLGGTLTIDALNTLNANSFDLSLGGNWVNNGTFTGSAGKSVIFNGSAAQTLSGSSVTTFKGLTVNNSAGVTVSSGSYLLDEVLTLSNGTFNTGGNSFTMNSTATQTARIAPITGTGAIAGNVIVQRFINSRDTTWADLSSPVQNSTYGDWANELPVVYYVYSPPYQYPTQYTYDETADDFSPVTSAATALTPGKGFEVFLAGDFSYNNLPNTTINTIGVPNQGDQDLSSLISFNNAGSNLVGNPFASSISWNSVLASSSGILNTYDVYDYTAGTYATYGAGSEIGSAQGFWVYTTTTAATLHINESAKTTSSNSSLKAAVAQPYFTLKLSGNDAGNHYYHVLKVAADDVSSDGWDNNDHPFRQSPNKLAPAIYTMIDAKKSVINSFSLSNDSYSMPIRTAAGISGSYTIEAAGFENISDYTCIRLEDKKLNKTIDLAAAKSYTFTMNTGDNTDRFIVHFSKNTGCSSFGDIAKSGTGSDFENNTSILPTAEGNAVTFGLAEATPAVISVTNVLGQNIVESTALSAQSQTVNIALPQGFSGMYIVKVESAKGVITKKYVRK